MTDGQEKNSCSPCITVHRLLLLSHPSSSHSRGVIIFTAFDKVHYTQFGLYQEYSEMNPLNDEGAVDMARAILSTTPKESVSWGLTTLLRMEKDKGDKVALEFDLFAVMSASGAEFDLYLVDEDGLLRAVVAAVEEQDVLATGVNMLDEFAAKRVRQSA